MINNTAKWIVKWVFISVVTVLSCTACNKYNKTLIEGLSSKSMSELTLKLYREGILSEVVKQQDGTYTIMVESHKYLTANEILLSLGLFHTDNQDKILKLATKSSMVETPLEQQFKFNQIIAQELSTTLSNLRSVIYAEVYISSDLSAQSDNIDFSSTDNDNSPPLKASVLLKVNSMTNTSPEELINNAKSIVAGAVKGLTTDNVYVVIENG
jgi:type III secretory pathway lipoprotein EscJ